MRKKYVFRILLIVLMVIIAVAVPVMYSLNSVKAEESNGAEYITVWQIDGFEGGKGSRKQFIANIAQKLFEGKKVYFTVHSLTADSARENIGRGNVPDAISYPSGFYGIENLVNTQDFNSKVWCHGCYCLLTLDTNSDFSDVNTKNTIINIGKDNLSSVCTVLIGLNGGATAEPTNAYLQLLNGKYKYMLGTQRDIYRLETRKAVYTVKAVSEFNDLFQNFSILTRDSKKYAICKDLIEELAKSDVSSLGLFGNGAFEPAEQLRQLKFNGAEYTIRGLCSKSYTDELITSAKNGDVKNLKSILR